MPLSFFNITMDCLNVVSSNAIRPTATFSVKKRWGEGSPLLTRPTPF